MEKRRHRRLKAQRVAGHVRADTRTAACAVENISAGGMFVRTAVALPVGVAVLVDLVRPGFKEPIQVSGRVVNVVPTRDGDELGLAPGIGIAFDPLPDEVRRSLRGLLRQLNVEQPPTEPPEAAPTPAADKAEVDDTVGLEERLVGLDDGLFANVKGMFDELSRAQAELQARDEEIANLKAEIRRLRGMRRPTKG